MTPPSGSHAVVVGASLAGLLAGRALARHFEKVTILERDDLAAIASGGPRRGVPQARHVHVLLRGGLDAVESLLPGIGSELDGCGVLTDMSSELWWFHFGVWKLRFPSGITSFFCDRLALERAIRRRVEAIGNIELRSGATAEGLLAEGGRVTGVQVANQEKPQIAADLVIDASGRGSRAPQWLADLGYPRPEVSEVGVDVGYASRLYRIPADCEHDWKVMAIFPRPPETKRVGMMYPLAGGRMLVTLGGWCGDHPPTDDEGYTDFAATLPAPDIHRFVEAADPLTPIVVHRFPSNLRRRYERSARWPEGFAVVGDAACSFNPIYGQGMSVGALQAEALDQALASRSFRKPGFARGFQKRVARLASTPWLLATGEDFRYPEATGDRPPGIRLVSRYFGHVLELSAESPAIHRRFLKVMNFLAGPLVMFTPGVVLRVLLRGLRMPEKAASLGRARAAEAAGAPGPAESP